MIHWIMAARSIGLPGLAAMWIGFFGFVFALFAARRRAGAEARGNATRSRRSMVGIAIQGFGIFLAGFGTEHIVLDPLGGTALVEAAALAVLMAIVVGLFAWATRTMGRNWSVVARTRGDHTLVTDGPFRHVRHPIYAALFLLMVALAIATGHGGRLVFAVPLFAAGTGLRITVEERLLRMLFGPEYDAWVARTPRFVPGVF